ncbi:MAG: sigma-70 family RNA polymerase sigma factor [Planctomycetota bacterium]|jgi:RNA polymerase sigma factor (TIGR02999 family)
MIQHQPALTRLLADWQRGDADAGRRVFAMVYGDLRRLAGHYLRGEKPDHTLQATALVHEAYLRLVGETTPAVTNRGHLVALSARLMRQILVNHALKRGAAKRGGNRQRVPLAQAAEVFEARCTDLVALDEALERLAAVDPRLTEIVELRFFGGLSVAETARLLDASPRTVERQWSLARAWLRQELEA